MKALRIVIIILVVIVAIILIPPLFMPSQLNIEISRELKAQPEVIWDQVNCLENWEEWDLWHQDSNMVGQYEGPACGEGATNVWTYKNMDDGGSQTIVESRKHEYLKTFLDFQKMGTAESEIFLEPVDQGTKVTWTLVSDASYPVMRWINTLMIAPGVKKAYTEGLKNLDELTEGMEPMPEYNTGAITMKEVEAMDALVIRLTASVEEMAEAMGTAFGKVMPVAGQHMAGPPFAIWYTWEGDQFDFACGVPVKQKVSVSGDLKNQKTYAGNTVMVTHTGSYESTQYSWAVLEEYVENNDLETAGDPWEVYIKGPMEEQDQTKWITELYWPVK